MTLRRISEEVGSYLVLPAFWIEFWPFVPALLFLLGAGVLWPWRRAAARQCLKTAVFFFVFGAMWVSFLL